MEAQFTQWSTPPADMMGCGQSVESIDGSASSRFHTFTEAVPLSLSSLAHMNVPLNEGVLDGVRQVLQHTLLQCVNYARMVHSPHQWNFRDIATSPFAWTPRKTELNIRDLPLRLQQLDFKHQYTRSAGIYLQAKTPECLTLEKELEKLENWNDHMEILGRVVLLYASTEALTPGEIEGTDVEDIPPCILYKVIVEYRSLPATGNQQAVQAEELSMLSFGGSIDDDVKYGALASLYDKHAKYVLEIYSVRGKRYKFDLMDSTLSSGVVPRIPNIGEGDPFVKSLCMTVVEHSLYENRTKNLYAITGMHLTLEGKPRKYARGTDDWHKDQPTFNHVASGIVSSFLHLNPNPPEMVTASPSGHSLLLDPELAGQIYIDGHYVTTWGRDPRIGSDGIALFGMDLRSVPFWQNRILDFEVMKLAYAVLWHEILIDARLIQLHMARRLLYMLMKGENPPDDDEEIDLYEDDGLDDPPDVHKECLESLVLAAPHYDRVGIAAKALATRFSMEFGKKAFPCLAHEVEWVRSTLGDHEPVVVPQRLINILRRGGYFDAQQTADLLWFAESRPVQSGFETDVVNIAVRFLEAAGCTDVDLENVVLATAPIAENAVAKDAVCRWNPETEQFFVQQNFLTAPVEEYIGENTEETNAMRIKGYLLGMYIAKAHPFGKVLPRYLVRNNLS